MGVRWTRRLQGGVAVAGLSIVAVGAVAVAFDGSRPARSTREASPRAVVAVHAQFYRDARSSLAPLLVHLSQQSQLFSQLLQNGGSVGAGVAELARTWTEDAATARDLVGRLLAPPSARPAQTLYRLAASLYVESARTLAAATASPTPLEEVRAARRLQLLGDSVFDAGHRRLVPSTDDGTVPVERPPTAVVPDFAAAGLAPAAADHAAGIPAGNARHRLGIVAQQTATWLSGGPLPAGGPELAAAELRSVSDALRAGSGPTAVSEADLAPLRLSALVEAEAVRGPAPSDGARRLHLLAAALWAAGTEAESGGVDAADGVFPLGGLDVTLLDGGGLFNGHPPALKPGDPPDKGVPGGLPSLTAGLPGMGG
ncbi:MAG TPA: hypothetical protein VEG38_05005 [Acidimicrobiia bacterium]|nr:hypothetical protein [Acidimicrobiia bacterium]